MQSSQLVSSRKLYLGEGSACIVAEASLYHTGVDVFSLYLRVGGQTPVRFDGPLGMMMNKGQQFVDARNAEGYSEDLPQYTPAPIN